MCSLKVRAEAAATVCYRLVPHVKIVHLILTSPTHSESCVSEGTLFPK